MKPFKEKIHNKLYSMASILLDNVIIPGETKQEGSDSIIASYYDDNGNKFTFTLSLSVVPEANENTSVEEPLSLADQVGIILEKVMLLENEVARLSGYHDSMPAEPGENPTEG